MRPDSGPGVSQGPPIAAPHSVPGTPQPSSLNLKFSEYISILFGMEGELKVAAAGEGAGDLGGVPKRLAWGGWSGSRRLDARLPPAAPPPVPLPALEGFQNPGHPKTASATKHPGVSDTRDAGL